MRYYRGWGGNRKDETAAAAQRVVILDDVLSPPRTHSTDFSQKLFPVIWCSTEKAVILHKISSVQFVPIAHPQGQRDAVRSFSFDKFTLSGTIGFISDLTRNSSIHRFFLFSFSLLRHLRCNSMINSAIKLWMATIKNLFHISKMQLDWLSFSLLHSVCPSVRIWCRRRVNQ